MVKNFASENWGEGFSNPTFLPSGSHFLFNGSLANFDAFSLRPGSSLPILRSLFRGLVGHPFYELNAPEGPIPQKSGCEPDLSLAPGSGEKEHGMVVLNLHGH